MQVFPIGNRTRSSRSSVRGGGRAGDPVLMRDFVVVRRLSVRNALRRGEAHRVHGHRVDPARDGPGTGLGFFGFALVVGKGGGGDEALPARGRYSFSLAVGGGRGGGLELGAAATGREPVPDRRETPGQVPIPVRNAVAAPSRRRRVDDTASGRGGRLALPASRPQPGCGRLVREGGRAGTGAAPSRRGRQAGGAPHVPEGDASVAVRSPRRGGARSLVGRGGTLGGVGNAPPFHVREVRTADGAAAGRRHFRDEGGCR
mmetsp:Transcript_17488/g.37796  ORF Transcript_17488/g.37796 Transcript_17488/m.37796 type:complete len:259 (-) Transcript_17488:393-1169(-)